MLHVRQGKGRKDRYVPLSDMLIRGLQQYITTENPVEFLFNGQPDKSGKPTSYTSRGVQWVIRETRKQLGIEKEITAHTFIPITIQNALNNLFLLRPYFNIK